MSSRAACAAAALVIAAGSALAVPGCGPAPGTPAATDASAPAAGSSRADTILVASSRGFAGSTRAAEILRDMAGATDVLGPVRFEVLDLGGTPPSGWLAPLSTRLRSGGLRAAILLAGDLSLFDNLDPSQPDRTPGPLISRKPRLAELEHSLGQLETAAHRQGVPLLLATAPIGRPGRIEVPELLEVAAALRSRGVAFDLAKDFAALGPAPLFLNGIDRLDDYGHDELARALFRTLADEVGPLPPRDEGEARARRQRRALDLWWRGGDEEFIRLAEELLADPVGTPVDLAALRASAREAAIACALRGWAAEAWRWEAMLPAAAALRDEGAAPDGLAAAAALLQGASPLAFEADGYEGALREVLVDLADPGRRDRGLASAEALVAAAPQRVEGWLVLQLATAVGEGPRLIQAEALASLRLTPRFVPAIGRAETLMRGWIEGVKLVPALLQAGRPLASLLPSGPALETARRRARLGFEESARQILEDLADDSLLPPGWRPEELPTPASAGG